MSATQLNGVYAVCVSPDISDEPVRWLFVNEQDADDFAKAIGPGAFVTFEPIAYSIDDTDFAECFPEEHEVITEMRRLEP